MLKVIVSVFAGCFLLERMIPGWKLPKVRTWPIRVVGVNMFQLGVVLLADISWEKWFAHASLFKLGSLHPWTGGALAYFIATFVFYWWHRWRHEMHRIHHQYGRHKNNYGDITWWDMLFGTYENPRDWDDKCGFDEARENRLLAMLAYEDVNR